jgi:Protein of unknown function (DUF3102)
MRVVETNRVETLAGLAAQIQTEVEAIDQQDKIARAADKNALQRAMHCGDLLLKAKAMVRYGGWLVWLGKEIPFLSERTAHDYMRLARYRREIEERLALNGPDSQHAVGPAEQAGSSRWN